MNKESTQLELKLKDYRRFIGTLLILASYLYVGSIIFLYIRQVPDGNVLAMLSFVALLATGWFQYQTHRLKIKINENERV